MTVIQMVLVLTACLPMTFSESAGDTLYVDHETKLLGDLLNRYNKMAIPRFNSSANVTVRFGIMPINLVELNEKQGYMSQSYWLNFEWWDLRLRWNESVYGGIQSIRISTDAVWLPDVKPYNSARRDHSIAESDSATVVVYSDGKVTYLPAVLYETLCDFDMHHFPYDVQECTLKLGSWTYDGSVVDLTLRGTEMEMVMMAYNHDWEMESASIERNVHIYDCCPEPYIDIECTFRLRRRPDFFRDLYIIPAIIMASLVPFVFALPVTRIHRYILGGFLLLVFTQLLMAFDSNVPTTTGGTPLLGQLFVCLQALVAISLLVSAALTNLATKETGYIPPPGFVQTIIIERLGGLLRISRSKAAAPGVTDDDGDVAISSTVSSTWLTVAQILDRLFFLIYCLAYLIMAIAFAAVKL